MARKICLFFGIFVAIRLLQTGQGDNSTCAKNEFTCDDGECILRRWKCDDEPDCKDSSDEKNCESYLPCSTKQFQCKKSKRCINLAWRCDGDKDCGDWSDELECHVAECTTDQHRCTNGLCIVKGYLCDGDNDCGDNSDEQSCGSLQRCKANQFRCDGWQCIYKHWRCDGEEDCVNGNDEKNCTKKSCSPSQWACQSGECVPRSHRCDGETDCEDYSDEIGCPTVAAQCKDGNRFRCASGSCIKKEWRCDGDSDCSDGSDEKDCGNKTCDNDNFLCTSGKCIPNHWLCDGERDCNDGVDERNCTGAGNSSCPRGRFRCINSQCIDQDKVCNRVKDCSDGSDETSCPSWQNQTSCGTNNGGCQHKCHDEGGSYRCSCENGYQLDRDDLNRCIDVDECEIDGFCSQKCVNTDGNYTCSCIDGYVLLSDRRKCKASGPAPSLIFSNLVDIRRLETQSVSGQRISIVDGLENAIALDYHFQKELLFWTDTTLRTIKRAFMNGTNAKTIVKFGVESPCGLAVDWFGRKLYWVDSGSGRIEVSNFDGGKRKAVFWQPLGRMRSIALHPTKGYMFWTEWDVTLNLTKSSISRANMDGSDVKRILHQEVAWPNGVAVDYAMDRIFWIDAKPGKIGSSDLNGRFVQEIMRNEVLQPFAITLFEDVVYWTDTRSKAIFMANKFDGSHFSLVRRNLQSPAGIVMFHRQRQPTGRYSCAENNGGCSHLCLPTSSGFSCGCPTGYRLSNSTHCSDDIDEFLAYVGDFVVRQISLDTDDMVDVVMPFESVMDVFAMDWDPVMDEMYWADVEDDKITVRKGRMKPPHHEAVVVEFPGKLSGLGLDWLSRKLYWSDEERNHIAVSNFDGTSVAVVLWKKVVKPRNLILDIQERYMYWSSHGDTVGIHQAGMDGSSRTKLVSRGLLNPTDLTLDKTSNALYWADGGSDLHYFLFSTKKRKIIKVSHHSKVLAPFSIAVRGNDIYWTDSTLRKVLHAKRHNTKDSRVIGKFKSNPVKIALFQRSKTLERHVCNDRNRTGCSHLCLLSPRQEYRCACPVGRTLGRDNRTCQSASPRFLLVNSNERLHQVPLRVPYRTSVLFPGQGNKDILAFDVDVKNRNLYFLRNAGNKKDICYVSLNGGQETCILSRMLQAAGDIALDPVRRYIYWTDFVSKKIYLSDGQGRYWTVVIWTGLDIPSSIAVAYKHGYIFWVDLGKRISISRANMDGTSPLEIVTSDLESPNGLTVDHYSKNVYWADYQLQRIELCNFRGQNRRILAKGLAGPTAISLFSKFVYWTEWDSSVIKKADKQNRGNGITVIKGVKGSTGLKTVNLDKIPVSKSFCEQKNGGCSHFCLKNPTGISCVCPVGLKLLEDRKTCETEPETSILFSTGKTIDRVSLDTSDFTAVSLPFNDPVNAVGLAFDITGERVFWTDTRSIYSAFVNGSDKRTIIHTNHSSVHGLTVDWIGRNLFWTNSRQDTIEVSRLNGSSPAVLMKNLDKPRDLAVHPIKGFVFWTECGTRPRIERSYMDGQSRHVLVSNNIRRPSGLAIDFKNDFLYWTESYHHVIERCDFSGEKRVRIINKSGHPFSLAIFESYVYWTDRRNHVLQRANKKTGTEQSVLHRSVAGPTGIVVASRQKSAERSACSVLNGGCNLLCLSTPYGRTCATVFQHKLYFEDQKETYSFMKHANIPFMCAYHGTTSRHEYEAIEDKTINESDDAPESTTTRPTFTTTTTRCDDKDGEECNGDVMNISTPAKTTVKLAYIVGAIVLVVFVVTISILAFLCHRRYKSVLHTRAREKPTSPLRVLFKKTKSKNVFHEGEIFANDPSVNVLLQSPPSLEKCPTGPCRSNHKRGLTVVYQARKPSQTDVDNECQKLTISDL